MDNLKKYLQDNKSKMDVDAPRDAVWEAIQQKTTTKKQHAVNAKLVVRYLAAACVLTAIVFGFKWMNNNQTIVDSPKITIHTPTIKNNPNTVLASNIPSQEKITDTTVIIVKPAQVIAAPNNKKKSPIPIKAINPIVEAQNQAINHLENGYGQMVKLQLNRIRNTPVFAEGPDYFNSFKTQLQQMDKDEADVRKFIKTNGLTNELLEQLINVSQQKLNLLKTLQTEINKMNNQVKQTQLPADSIKTFYLHI